MRACVFTALAVLASAVALAQKPEVKAAPPHGFGSSFNVLPFGKPDGIPRQEGWMSGLERGTGNVTLHTAARAGRGDSEKTCVAVFEGTPFRLDGVTKRFGKLLSVRHFTIPAVKEGQLVPIFGVMYRATDDSGSEFKFERVEIEDLPKGIEAVRLDSLYLPIDTGREEGIETHGYSGLPWLATESISDDKIGSVAVVKMKYVHYGSGIELGATVRVGDLLAVPGNVDAGFIVRGIVPPQKGGAIGWVELSAKPIPADEIDAVAEKEKRTVVAPDKLLKRERRLPKK